MSKLYTNKKSIKNTNTTTNNDTIDALWVMGGASVIKDYATKEVKGYYCYCNTCKAKSVSGDGGIAFNTAEELLEHRNMKAFKCPSGCGFHVCEERGSIMRHLDGFHKEVMTKLEKEGLDPKKSWIYPDSSNHTYTLMKPMPEIEDKSPLEQGAMILALTPPKRVYVPPSPTPPSPVSFNSKSWDIVTPKTVSLNNIFMEQTETKSVSEPKNEIKGWRNLEKPNFTSLANVIMEQQEEHTDDDECIHYAQEDMRKEKQCPFGINCTKKDRPFSCAMNHDGKGDIIKMGTILTDDILCPYERPGPGPEFIRCFNGHCTKIHLEGRVEFIEKKKKVYFENKKQIVEQTKTETETESDNDVSSTVLSVNENGINLLLGTKDAIAISAALHELEMIEQDTCVGEWISPRTGKTKNSKKHETETLTMTGLVSELTISE